VAKTITAPITHFSDWTPFDVFNLTPSSAAIRVGETVELHVTFVDPGIDDADLSVLYPKIQNSTGLLMALQTEAKRLVLYPESMIRTARIRRHQKRPLKTP